MHRGAWSLAVVVSAIATLAPVTAFAGGDVRAGGDVPTLTGAVTGGTGRPNLVSTTFDLGEVGYAEAEYFISGTAIAYSSSAPLTPDGEWNVEGAGTAPYTTRIVVRRPVRARDFNGTVFVEWLNVSAGFDSAPDWGSAHNAIIGSGAAWVGVSAQPLACKEAPRPWADCRGAGSSPPTRSGMDR